MRNAALLRHRQLRRANVEVAINLQRIAIDDFAIELAGQEQSQIALSGAGRTDHRNQWPRCRVTVYSVGG